MFVLFLRGAEWLDRSPAYKGVRWAVPAAQTAEAGQAAETGRGPSAASGRPPLRVAVAPAQSAEAGLGPSAAQATAAAPGQVWPCPTA